MSQIEPVLERARDFRAGSAPRDVAFRAAALRKLAATIDAREQDLLDALHTDLRKPAQEAYASEIGVVQTDIRHALRNLSSWTRPRRRRTGWGLAPARGRVHAEPLGVVLILGPWNFPFTLLFSPLVGALAAGNCAVLKPSEYAPAVSAAAARVVREAFEPGYVTVCQGGADVARSLVELRFDHIFLTGSEAIGRQVMDAAARHLTPVTLELGGKCPCYVAADARLRVAARRIVWGKFLNAGQTCVAPDHVLVHRSICDDFVAELKDAVRAFYGEDPRSSEDYGRIVNRVHFDRLASYLAQGSISLGGETDPLQLYIAPTILTDPDPSGAVMTEEIFGPILPVLEYEDLDAALEAQAAKPKPLAAYLFSEDRALQDRFVALTVSGGVGLNDVVNQIVPKELPFGGIGASGMGQYHGKAGFDRFTHYRSVLRRSTRFDPGYTYPPARHALKKLKRAYRWLYRS